MLKLNEWFILGRGKFTVGSEARQKSWKCGKNGKVGLIGIKFLH